MIQSASDFNTWFDTADFVVGITFQPDIILLSVKSRT